MEFASAGGADDFGEVGSVDATAGENDDAISGSDDWYQLTLAAGTALTVTTSTPGSATGQFVQPNGIAIEASAGNVYVADTLNNRIQEFGPTGVFIRAFGSSTIMATDEGRRLADSTTESARQITLVTQQQRTGTEQVSQSMRDITGGLTQSKPPRAIDPGQAASWVRRARLFSAASS